MRSLEKSLKLEEKVENVLNELRPALEAHGGDVKLIDITKENVVKVEFIGNCKGCPIADFTLDEGLKEAIMMQIEEIDDVVDVTKH